MSESASGPADITIERFHELADTYLEALIEKLEELQEETEEVDVEYSVRTFRGIWGLGIIANVIY